MATVNKVKPRPARRTHQGAPAANINAKQELRRSVMACMLWEDEFYEDGNEIAARIRKLVAQAKPQDVAAIAVEARSKMNLRHVPLLLVRELARDSKRLEGAKLNLAAVIAEVIQRPDELTELIAIYQKDGKNQPLAAQVKKGLALALDKFTEETLAKYDRDGAVKLRDVLRIVHPKPSRGKAAMYGRIVKRTLKRGMTWEEELSKGKDKKKTWMKLLKNEALGGLALLRNLRNMTEAEVDEKKVKDALGSMSTRRILPFRFIAAARFAPQFEAEIEAAMFRSLAERSQLIGPTAILVDVSGSMDQPLSAKSDMRRVDAACGLAMVIREICPAVEIYTFSQKPVRVPSRRGFALRDAIVNSQPHGNTFLGSAVEMLRELKLTRNIIITDEQSHDAVRPLTVGKNYIINVASARNGIGYAPWVHIDGWSDAVIDYIQAYEREE